MNTLEDVREDGRRRQNELPSNYAAQSRAQPAVRKQCWASYLEHVVS